MDIRRSINTRIWSDDWFESLTPSEKLLWVYFLTNAQTNMLGIYEISLKRIQFETGLNKETIEKALKGFETVKKAFYNNGFIILPNWLKNQAMNPNMVKSAESLFFNLPNHLIDCLISNGYESFESLSKGCLILPKKEKEKEIEKESLNGNTESNFIKDVFSFSQYPQDMLQSFCNYWTEKDSRGKMLFQKRETFEISKRLVTWKNNQKKQIASWQ